ncbi:hypothetical protein FLA_2333 [Filimonas lacunae]|nr:hypothetical protein FLA_2333 [Filimonas lacunae]
MNKPVVCMTMQHLGSTQPNFRPYKPSFRPYEYFFRNTSPKG